MKWLVTRARTPPGFKASTDLAKKKSCSDSLWPPIFELDVGEGHVADHRVDAALGQLRVAEILDADVGLRVERPGDAAGDAVQSRRR